MIDIETLKPGLLTYYQERLYSKGERQRKILSIMLIPHGRSWWHWHCGQQTLVFRIRYVTKDECTTHSKIRRGGKLYICPCPDCTYNYHSTPMEMGY